MAHTRSSLAILMISNSIKKNPKQVYLANFPWLLSYLEQCLLPYDQILQNWDIFLFYQIGFFGVCSWKYISKIIQKEPLIINMGLCKKIELSTYLYLIAFLCFCNERIQKKSFGPPNICHKLMIMEMEDQCHKYSRKLSRGPLIKFRFLHHGCI